MFLDIIEGYNDALVISIIIVGVLIIIMSIIATIVEIFLAISYIRYNRTQNSIGKTGEEVAREILDKNGLNKIRVSKNGSILFGNSYSHYFKKVRLRRLTYKKKSVTSLAMAAQKSSLAILDAKNDPDMKTRIVLTPITYFGPLAFIPLVITGVLLDLLLFKTNGVCTIIFSAIGFSVIFATLFLQIMELKTERKAQAEALEILKKENMVNSNEVEMMKKLFHLYNIEYVNNIILSTLEIIYRILTIALKITSKQNNFSSKK